MRLKLRRTDRKRVVFIMITAIILLILNSAASHAISLGDVPPSTTQIFLSPGETAKIKLGFFNPGEEDISVSLSYDGQIESTGGIPDLRVYLQSKSGSELSSFVLPGGTATTTPSSGKDWVLMPDGKTYVELKPVYVVFDVPSKSIFARNRYKIVVYARAMSMESASSENVGTIYQKIGQERQYTFDVVIRTSAISSVGEESNEAYTAGDTDLTTTDTSLQQNYETGGEELTTTTEENGGEGELTSKGGGNEEEISEEGSGETQEVFENPTIGGEKTENRERGVTGLLTASKSKINAHTIIIVLLGIAGIAFVWKR